MLALFPPLEARQLALHELWQLGGAVGDVRGAKDSILKQGLGLRVIQQHHGGSPEMYRRQPTRGRSCWLHQSRTVKLG